MKKSVILLALTLLSISLFSQIYLPVNPTTYGRKENRIKADSATHVTEKAGNTVNTADTTAQVYYNKADSSIWGYSLARGHFKISDESDIPPTPVISDSAWSLTGNNITYGKYIGTNNDYDLRFFTNGVERMRIDSASKTVVIGEASHNTYSGTQLQISNNSGQSRLLLTNSTFGSTGTYGLKLETGIGSATLMSDANGTFTFGSNSQVALGINNAGEVLVGTTFVDYGVYSLQVNGGTQLDGAVIINESGANNDFRVEGDTDPNLFFTDASADEVYIGTNTDAGAYKLQVNGNSYFSGGSTTIHDNNLIVNTSTLTERKLSFTYLGTEYGKIYVDWGGFLTFKSSAYNLRFKTDAGSLYFESPGTTEFVGSTQVNINSSVATGSSPKFGFKYATSQYNSQWIDWNTAQYKNQTLTSVGYSAFFGGETSGLLVGHTGAVINDEGVNFDFRVEGDTDPNLFWTDASKDEVYIAGTTDYGDYKLQVGGGIAANGNSVIYGNTYVSGVLSANTISQAGAVLSINMLASLGRNIQFNDDGTPGAYNYLEVLPNDGFGNITSGDANLIIANPTINQSSGAGNIIGYRFKPTVTAAYSKIYSIYADTGMVYIDDKVGIGTANPTHSLHVAGTVKIVDGTQGLNKVLTSDANGVASWQTPPAGLTLDEGSYTPTLTNTTNIGASTATTTYWFRVGDRIYVFGSVEIDATSAGTLSELGLTLPVGSSIVNESDLAGTAAHEDGTPIRICGDTVNNRAKFKFTPNTATANKYSFHFSYLYVAP